MEFLIPLTLAIIFCALLFIYQDNQNDLFRPNKIYIIRHGEKNPNEFYLNSQGKERALLLVDFIRKINPVALYTPVPRNNGDDFRPRQTIEPASFELNIPIYGNYYSFQTEDAVQEIFSKESWHGKVIFICWEHTCIQKLIQSLIEGNSNETFSKFNEKFNETFENVWNSDDFSTVYILDYDEVNGKYSISKSCENLLSNDSEICSSNNLLGEQACKI